MHLMCANRTVFVFQSIIEIGRAPGLRTELEAAMAQARSLEPDALPELLGDLENIRATALARLMAQSRPVSAEDRLLDIDEAATTLGVSLSYLYRHSKTFPFTRRMGRKILFSSAGIEQYLRRNVLTPRRLRG